VELYSCKLRIDKKFKQIGGIQLFNLETDDFWYKVWYNWS